MLKRLLNPLKGNSFFLFGARGTGKSTLVGDFVKSGSTCLIDLLDPRIYDDYLANSGLLLQRFGSQQTRPEWIVIDEVQRLPALLNEVHKLIFEHKQKFILTGSSARKLKRGGANLLAGRAYTYNLYPLTHLEYGERFNLDEVLQWGGLPQVAVDSGVNERREYLSAYVSTYMKEEIISEQVVRKIEGFRRFLKVAAQVNGTILNFDKIAKDVGIDPTTVKSYFEILEDTLVGFLLPAFNRSIRKQQRQAPKFYFFDCGVQRALLGIVDHPITPATYGYGKAFEHFIILEILRLSSYGRKSIELSYLRTKDDAEIDLIIERPGEPLAIVEIKSSTMVDDTEINKLARLKGDFPNCRAIVLSNEPLPRRANGVEILPWRMGIESLNLGETPVSYRAS